MPSERRTTHRYRGPFEATWSGASSQRRVRIADVSLSGCFIEDLAAPRVGERVDLTLFLPGGPPVHAGGTVVYIYPAQGFAVTFEHDEGSSAQLHEAVDRLAQY